MAVEIEPRWHLSPGTEQGLLRISIVVVVAFAALGVLLGLLSVPSRSSSTASTR